MVSEHQKQAREAAIQSARAHREKLKLPENYVINIAAADGRDYITPEDIGNAFKSNDVTKVRLDVLEVLGNTSGFGAEDRSLCAYIAFMGEADYEPDAA